MSTTAGSGGPDCGTVDDGRAYCYTDHSVCSDGMSSSQLPGYDYSYLACSSPDPAPAPVPGPNANNISTRLGVVAFATTARIVIGLTNSETAVDTAVRAIKRVKGNTAIGDAINLGQSMLAAGLRKKRAMGSSVARPSIIFLLTDGVNNKGLLLLLSSAACSVPCSAPCVS